MAKWIIVACAAVLSCTFFCNAFAGETAADRLGISARSANRDVDRIRRAQNRKTRDINELNGGSDGMSWSSAWCE